MIDTPTPTTLESLQQRAETAEYAVTVLSVGLRATEERAEKAEDCLIAEQESRERAEARAAALEDALREIKDTQGKVCAEFEFCNHTSCASSYASWAIADAALSTPTTAPAEQSPGAGAHIADSHQPESEQSPVPADGACPNCGGLLSIHGKCLDRDCGWEPSPAPTAEFLIWSNEHRAWWRPNSAGYTLSLGGAGRYGREEAEEICAGAGNGPNGRPNEVMVAAPRRRSSHDRP